MRGQKRRAVALAALRLLPALALRLHMGLAWGWLLALSLGVYAATGGWRFLRIVGKTALRDLHCARLGIRGSSSSLLQNIPHSSAPPHSWLFQTPPGSC
ncbi:unnamed protein product [Lampetra planeri]